MKAIAAKPILVSGMQPTGRLHVGNYLGALKNFVDLQNSEKYQCYFFVADLHALTGTSDPKNGHEMILNLLADYMAAGIDPKRSIIFQQSQIPAHSELTWILNTVASMGDLERMTQFKDKAPAERQMRLIENGLRNSDAYNQRVEKYFLDAVKLLFQLKEGRKMEARNDDNAGLFDYPVLMASDILLYDADIVPVGDDQLQHLELTRTLARKFNNKFGKTFFEPKDLLTKTPRVMSLKDPSKKMSKSQPEGCLFLDNSPEEIKAKIARAVTDSDAEIAYNPEKKPGLSNLLEIYSALTHMDPHLAAKEFSGESYAALKQRITEVVASYFVNFREKKRSLLAQPSNLVKTLNAGSKQASKIAEKKMLEVKKKIGLAL